MIDRICILDNSKRGMLASVLNPAGSAENGQARSSVLPFLARQYGRDPEVSGLLRPQMPIIKKEATVNGEMIWEPTNGDHGVMHKDSDGGGPHEEGADGADEEMDGRNDEQSEEVQREEQSVSEEESEGLTPPPLPTDSEDDD